jgi:hypothetical protein
MYYEYKGGCGVTPLPDKLVDEVKTKLSSHRRSPTAVIDCDRLGWEKMLMWCMRHLGQNNGNLLGCTNGFVGERRAALTPSVHRTHPNPDVTLPRAHPNHLIND